MSNAPVGTTQHTYDRAITISRPIPDKLIHLNRTLTRITAFQIIGPVTKHSEHCFSMMTYITCRQGRVPWLCHAYVDQRHGWRVYGDIYIPAYAAKPIRNAVFAAIAEYIRNE